MKRTVSASLDLCSVPLVTGPNHEIRTMKLASGILSGIVLFAGVYFKYYRMNQFIETSTQETLKDIDEDLGFGFQGNPVGAPHFDVEDVFFSDEADDSSHSDSEKPTSSGIQQNPFLN